MAILDLKELKPKKGSVKTRARKGRGNSSGLGGESGRGHKGQQSRSGYSRKSGFEGGQMPLYRRLPKLKGFKSLARQNVSIVNLDDLEKHFKDGDVVNKDSLREKNLIKRNSIVKILGRGELKKKMEIIADDYSKKAVAAITRSGGSVKPIC